MTDEQAVKPRLSGAGRILVIFYFLLALAATGRSVEQIATEFSVAPVAFLLSAMSGVVYIVATLALVVPGRAWYRVAIVTISFELIGVLVVGTLSLVDQRLFPMSTIWSQYGLGYGLVPLVLPVLGLLYLRSQRRVFARVAE